MNPTPLHRILILSALAVFILLPTSCSDDETSPTPSQILVDVEPTPEPTTVPENTTSIAGTVQDWETGEGLNEAIVFTQPPTERLLTNAQGQFIFSKDLESDIVYRVFVEKEGYVSTSALAISRTNKRTNVDIQLLRETVESPIVFEPSTLYFAANQHTRTHRITNNSLTQPNSWTVETPDWITATPSSTVIPPGQTQTVSFSLNPAGFRNLPDDSELIRDRVILKDGENRFRFLDAVLTRALSSTITLTSEDAAQPLLLNLGQRAEITLDTSANGLPLQGAKLRVNLEGSLAQTVITDVDGRARLSFVAARTGRNTLRVSFDLYDDVDPLDIELIVQDIGDGDTDGIDSDGDGSGVANDNPCTGGQTENCDDNCPLAENPNQADLDSDGVGDACDPDVDGDGVDEDGDNSGVAGDNPCTQDNTENCDDNCPRAENPNQADPDGDSIGSLCDVCPDDADPNQADFDSDGIGDVCDIDIDGDGVDEDGDGSGVAGDNPCANGQTVGCDDNCPDLDNPTQSNIDNDAFGDLCDPLRCDPGEANDSFEQAVGISPQPETRNEALCASDQDWFSLPQTFGDCVFTIDVTADFNGVSEDTTVDFVLVNIEENGTQTEQTRVTLSTTQPTAQLSYPSNQLSQPALFAQGADNLPDLPITITTQDTCPTCEDPTEPNDDPTQGAPITINNPASLMICPDDSGDWLTFDVEPGCWAVLNITAPSERIDTLDLQIFDATSTNLVDPIGLRRQNNTPQDGLSTRSFLVRTDNNSTLSAFVAAIEPEDLRWYTYTLELTHNSCACPDDFNEPNDTQTQALPYDPSNPDSVFIACASNEDWHTLPPLESYCVPEVYLNIDNADTVTFEVYTESSVEPVGFGEPLGDDQIAAFLQPSSSETYIARVVSPQDSNYTITASNGCDTSCSPDGFEPNNDINSPTSEIELNEPYNLWLCPGDEDYFGSAEGENTALSCTLSVELLTDRPGVVTEFLQNGEVTSATIVNESRGVWISSLSEFIPQDVQLSIRVLAEDNTATAPYELTLGYDCPCTDDEFEPNDSFEQALPLTGSVAGRACLGDQGSNDDWFTYQAFCDPNITVTAEDGDLELIISDGSQGIPNFIALETIVQGESFIISPDTIPQFNLETTYYFQILGQNPNAENFSQYTIDFDETCTCVDDNFEPNSQAEPTFVSLPFFASPSLCSEEGDEDWYAVTSLTPWCQLEASAGTFVPSQNISVEMELDGSFFSSSESQGLFSNSVFFINDGDQAAIPQFYYRSDSGNVPTYNANISESCSAVPTCPNDDIAEPNGTSTQAYPLYDASVAANPNASPIRRGQTFTLCPEGPTQEDWFSFEVGSECTLTVDVFLDANAPRDTQLIIEEDFSPSNNATVETTPYGLRATVTRPTGSLVTAGISSLQGGFGFTYGLRYDLFCGSVPPTCPANDLYEPNNDQTQAHTLVHNDAITGTLCDDTDQDWFEIFVPETCSLDVSFTNPDGPRSQDVRLSMTSTSTGLFKRTGLHSGSNLYRCTPDGPCDTPKHLSYFAETDDTVLLNISKSAVGSPDNYDLDIQLDCSDRPLDCPINDLYEPNNTPTDATPFTLQSTRPGILCGNETDQYTFEHTDGCDLQVAITSPREVGNSTTVTIFNSANTVVDTIDVQGGGGTIDRTLPQQPADLYRIVVQEDDLTGDESRTYELLVNSHCAPPSAN